MKEKQKHIIKQKLREFITSRLALKDMLVLQEESSNYRTIALILHASKVMLKILQAGLQQYVNQKLPDVQAEIEKAEEPEIKLPTPTGSSKKQESSRKTSISALLTIPKF